jgi:DNA-binding NtrC family response regulator
MFSEHIKNYILTSHLVSKNKLSLKESKTLFERSLIIETLKECKGNIAEAARRLGYFRPHLSRKIKQLKISVNVTKK